jgi:hypothetical protein
LLARDAAGVLLEAIVQSGVRPAGCFAMNAAAFSGRFMYSDTSPQPLPSCMMERHTLSAPTADKPHLGQSIFLRRRFFCWGRFW